MVDVRTTTLSSLIWRWKGASGRAANLLLGQSGRFWEREHFDTLIRDAAHLQRAIRYTKNNPVKARLVAERKSWPWGTQRGAMSMNVCLGGGRGLPAEADVPEWFGTSALAGSGLLSERLCRLKPAFRLRVDPTGQATARILVNVRFSV